MRPVRLVPRAMRLAVNGLVVVILCVSLFPSACMASETLSIFLAGDSTLSEKLPEKRPETGWGEILQDWFQERQIQVTNHAKNGRSTRTFIEEGRWEALVAGIKPGDYVFIQFGHNDQSENKPKRYTPPEAFVANLAGFVADVNELDAKPVLLTPVVRRRFDESGNFYDVHGVYPDLVREVATSTGAALIDLHASSTLLLEMYGAERSKDLFLWLAPGEFANYPDGLEDNTHFSPEGARAIASLVIQGVRLQLPELAKHLEQAPHSVSHPLFTAASGLFDPSQPATLGLEPAPGTESFTIFRPGENDPRYNHGAVLIPFKNSLYAQWQSSEKDEDSADTRVLYSISTDGRNWLPPRPLAGTPAGNAYSNGGWWTDGDTLVAFLVRWRDADKGVRSGVTEFIASQDGVNWSTPAPVLDRQGLAIDGVIEQDPHRLPGGRILSAFHMQPGLVLAPWYTDDPLGTSGWSRGHMPNLAYKGDSSREIEPSWFLRPDGAIVMVMRDQASSFFKLASVSHDNGANWSQPVLTNMPDSRSKQSAGNLPDGTAYLVGNPTTDKRRFPLVVALAADAFHFDQAFLLRAGGDDLPAKRFEGRFKRAGFSYPKSIVWDGYLYVSYATNKEDIEISRIPLTSLEEHEK